MVTREACVSNKVMFNLVDTSNVLYIEEIFVLKSFRVTISHAENFSRTAVIDRDKCKYLPIPVRSSHRVLNVLLPHLEPLRDTLRRYFSQAGSPSLKAAKQLQLEP